MIRFLLRFRRMNRADVFSEGATQGRSYVEAELLPALRARFVFAFGNEMRWKSLGAHTGLRVLSRPAAFSPVNTL